MQTRITFPAKITKYIQCPEVLRDLTSLVAAQIVLKVSVYVVQFVDMWVYVMLRISNQDKTVGLWFEDRFFYDSGRNIFQWTSYNLSVEYGRANNA